MTPTVRTRRTVFGVLAAGAACAALAIPAANADPDDTPNPAPAAATDDCNAATLASTVSSVTSELSTYFAAHPDANQALIDATRQPAFIAVGQFEAYTDAHPDQADADPRDSGAARRLQGSVRHAGFADRRPHCPRGPLSRGLGRHPRRARWGDGNPRRRRRRSSNNWPGPAATLRDDQWTAIEALVVQRRRALVVQRTGWGKSAVYFIAAKLLRADGHGADGHRVAAAGADAQPGRGGRAGRGARRHHQLEQRHRLGRRSTSGCSAATSTSCWSARNG